MIDTALLQMRVQLWGAAQTLKGDHLREFWKMVKEIWESREALLIDRDVMLAEVDEMVIG